MQQTSHRVWSWLIWEGFLVAICGVAVGQVFAVDDGTVVSGFAFDDSDDQLSLRLDGQPIASYLLRDEALTRRAFVNVHTPSGIPVTRPFPSQ